MTMAPEPPVGDDDDDILAALDFEPESDPDDVRVAALSDVDLSNLLADTREELFQMNEMMSDLQSSFGTQPGSPKARELHSLRLACIHEMRKRGLI